MKLSALYESVSSDTYKVTVSGYQDHPTLTIPGVGYITLFYSGSPIPHYLVHMIRGEVPRVGAILYFAGLDWALRHGIKDAHGQLASDSTLSPSATRARIRFQDQYGDFLMILPHPNSDSVKVHRADGSDWRRPATSDEATMWRLRRLGPFEFIYENSER